MRQTVYWTSRSKMPTYTGSLELNAARIHLRDYIKIEQNQDVDNAFQLASIISLIKHPTRQTVLSSAKERMYALSTQRALVSAHGRLHWSADSSWVSQPHEMPWAQALGFPHNA